MIRIDTNRYETMEEFKALKKGIKHLKNTKYEIYI